MSILNPKLTENLYVFGKYLDQPAIVHNLEKAVPIVAVGLAAGVGIYDVFKAPKDEKKKTAIRDFLVLSFALGAAFLTTRGLRNFHEKMHKHTHEAIEKRAEALKHNHAKHASESSHSHSHVHANKHSHPDGCGCHPPTKAGEESPIGKIISDIKSRLSQDKTKGHPATISLNKMSSELSGILEPPVIKLLQKAEKEEYLSRKEVIDLHKGLKKFGHNINEVIPDSHQHNPWGELGYLSLMGTVPVLGGVAGGVMADKINGDDIKEGAKDKIKEGIFQYLANITLCNFGAGLAMVGLDSAGIKNKAARFTGMMAGVVTVGMLFGGTIANYIGKKFVNPILDHKKSDDIENHHRDIINLFKHVNADRKPEPLDVALHIDDVASVGFLSGLKWIGPILPALYSISGYRAGIGYRNGEIHSHGAEHKHHKTFEDYKLGVLV